MSDSGSWTHWWYYNSRAYLGLKRSVHAQATATGDESYYLGRGQHKALPTSSQPSGDLLYGEIQPALLKAAQSCDCSAIRGTSLLALGKLGDHPGGGDSQPVREFLTAALSDTDRNVAEIAAISLGMLEHDQTAFSLANLLLDDDRGQQLRDRPRVEERVRAFAAYGLGLVGGRSEREDVRRFAASKLCTAFERARGGTQDVRVACLIGLGLVPLDTDDQFVSDPRQAAFASSCREAQIDWVLRVLDSKDLSFLVRAHAPTTLARLALDLPAQSAARQRVIDRLTTVLGRFSKQPREVQQSSVQALGWLGDADADVGDRSIRRTLMQVSKNLADQQTRAFALLALARIGGRPGSGAGDASASSGEVRTFLVRQLVSGKHRLRPWAGLALGLQERALNDSHVLASEETRVNVRRALQAARSPELVGALCIALGIMRDEGAAPILLEVLRGKNPLPRQHAMLALGMVGARQAIEPMRDILRASHFRPDLTKNAAIGLTLMNDKEVVPILLEMLERGTSSQRPVCIALAQVGDKRAVQALLERALDTTMPHATRSAALSALGGVADLDELPWNHKLAMGTNYLANTSTLSGRDTPGVLDLY